MSEDAIRRLDQRLTVLAWASTAIAALALATLGVVVNLSYQLGRLSGSLVVLINHVSDRASG